MPNCFQLTRKAAPQDGPVKLTEVDEEICKFLNVPCDPVKWVANWYNTIGFALACGRSFEQQRTEDFPESKLALKIINFLDENFTTDCWAEVGRH